MNTDNSFQTPPPETIKNKPACTRRKTKSRRSTFGTSKCFRPQYRTKLQFFMAKKFKLLDTFYEHVRAEYNNRESDADHKKVLILKEE